MNPYVVVTIREIWRGRACRALWFALILLYGLGLMLPPRLGDASRLALETLVALGVLASTLFAAILVAWPMGQSEWSWSLTQQGPLSRSPVVIIQLQALGQGLVWVAFLMSLSLMAVVGLFLQTWFMKTAAFEHFDWEELGLSTTLVLVQGFWLQALARALAAALPGALATLVLFTILIAGHFLGLQPSAEASWASWFRPGLEYLSQAQVLEAEQQDLPWLFALSLSAALCFNLLAAWILGKRHRGLVNLDPKSLGD